MDFYEVIEILIEGHTWNNEGRKADALEVVKQLRTLNALGTVTAQTDVAVHEHAWAWQYNGGYPDAIRWQVCTVCGKKMEPEPFNYRSGFYR
jgi:hypothetical protein